MQPHKNLEGFFFFFLSNRDSITRYLVFHNQPTFSTASLKTHGIVHVHNKTIDCVFGPYCINWLNTQ